jgi:uncharacterized protein YjiK
VSHRTTPVDEEAPPPAGTVPAEAPARDADEKPEASPAGEASDSDKADKAEKKRKKAEKLAEDAHRPLDAWERYRALSDAYDSQIDLVDLADHKARFALIIMGGLNAAFFVLGTRPEVLDAIPKGFRASMGGYLAIYALVALYFFIQAIESLRPRAGAPQVPYPGEAGLQDHPMGLRFYEDVLRRDLEAYRRAWREVHIGQLNAEVAVQLHVLSRINRAKYAALGRLYQGLQIMTVMAGGLLIAVGYFMFTAPKAEGLPPASRVGTGAAAPAGLGAPARLTGAVREPSGIAFHPRLGRLFVVGDEGRLAELDTDGRLIASHAVPGDLEGVAVHTPSGNLLLLEESRSELIWFDPAAKREVKRWRVDAAAVLGRSPGDPKEGFEGLAFREEPGRPGGGVFYLVHQRAPAAVVTLAFDPSLPAGRLGEEAVVGRLLLEGHGDLTAATYSESLGRLLVIAERKDRILVLGEDGGVEEEVTLPGVQQEGLAFDGDGQLWVADDRAGLLRFVDALPVFASRSAAPGGRLQGR